MSQPGIKFRLKKYLVAFQMLGLLMRVVNTFRYRPLDSHSQFVGDGGRRNSGSVAKNVFEGQEGF